MIEYLQNYPWSVLLKFMAVIIFVVFVLVLMSGGEKNNQGDWPPEGMV